MVSSAGPACVACGDDTVVRPVPSGCRDLLADDPALVGVCRTCLTVTPAPGERVTQTWDPHDWSDRLPRDPEASVAVAMLVTFLSSLALNRREATAVVEALETAYGVDPLAAFDQLAAAEAFTLQIDPQGRRDQLAQLLS